MMISRREALIKRAGKNLEGFDARPTTEILQDYIPYGRWAMEANLAKRAKIVDRKDNYFISEKTSLQFVSSGCTLLDCALGGGYPLGRIVNIVGDKSTSKTGMATEALINFVRAYPEGAAAYRDAEGAFITEYAAAMGLPIEKIDFGDANKPIATVEDLERDLTKFIEQQDKAKKPGIYIIDSLDALSDEAELEREIGEATYGGNKAKQLSTMFRKITARIERGKVLFIVISQVRDNIGALFGEKHKRSGGKSLDFYASQIFWLSHLKTLKRTINKVERAYGIALRAKVKKNKIGMPFREADMEFNFGYGIDDLGASLGWLKEIGRLDAVDLKESEYKSYIKSVDEMDEAEYRQELKQVANGTRTVWKEVEETFLPKRAKYGT